MDEKKKLMILGALAIVMVSVGVFSFTRGGGEEAPAPATPDPAATAVVGAEETSPTEPPKNPQLLALDYKRRDPFAVPIPKVDPMAGFVEPPRPTPSGSRPAGGVTGPITAVSVNNIGGSLPGAANDPQTAPTSAQPEVETEVPFAYTVSGVVIGRTPAAVFRDSAGNQKLVPQGARLDEDTRVDAVKLNYVSVRYRGKTIRLPIGGESVANK